MLYSSLIFFIIQAKKARYLRSTDEKQSMHGKFNDDSHSDILDVDMPPSSSQPEHINRKKRKASGDRRWTTDFLLQNPKSCLVNADLLVCNLIALHSFLIVIHV